MMLSKLKEATEELHREIEKDNLAGLVISTDIDLEQYKLLLLQNYIAYAVTETAIAKHLDAYDIQKTPRLVQDLEQLGVSAIIAPQMRDLFRVINRAEALGAAYVVEGSGLGGMLIAKHLKNCPALEHIEEHHFFNGDKANVRSWKAFKALLKEQEFTALEEIQAIDKAKDTFCFFGEVFKTTKLAV